MQERIARFLGFILPSTLKPEMSESSSSSPLGTRRRLGIFTKALDTLAVQHGVNGPLST